MKRILYLFVILFLFSFSLMAKIQSIATVSRVDKGVNVTLGAPYSETVFAGTFLGSVNSTTARFYCIDLGHELVYNSQYQDVNSTSSKVTYILNNYYPYKALPYTGSLTETNEAAAIQLAIWSFTDQLSISSCTPGENASAIKNRALAIIADANQNAGAIQPFKTLVINIPSQSFVTGSPVQFFVEAYNEVGAPIQGVRINISVNEGTLTQNSVTTNAAGVAGPVTLTAGSHNSTVITATGAVTIPGGTQYYNVSNPDGKQKLVIATPVNASKTVTAPVNWYNPVALSISKTSSSVTVNDGDIINYEISVKNTGSIGATGVQVTDVLPAILQFASADGNYNPATGIWEVGSLAVNETRKLKISVKADFNAQNATIFDLGIASDYNLFVLNDINQPSADTQGKLAVGRDAYLANYSVGDQLPQNSGDVLVVGRKLTYKSGRVYGDVAFGSFIDTTHWNLSDGHIRQASPIDFQAASLYLNNLSQQMAVLNPNGTVTFEYGKLALKGTNPSLNKFLVKGSDLSACNDFEIDVPENSVVLINVSGENPDWKGGYVLKGATTSNVLFNFYEATRLTISGIEVKASILAPRAALEFPSGLITGQVIVKDMNGSGQFNLGKFTGRITLDVTITNIAECIKADQPMRNSILQSMAQVTSEVNLTDVKKSSSRIPVKMDLLQNYPNPFNPSTQIRFDIPNSGYYTMKVYNMLGKEVAVLINGEYTPGSYNVSFDGSSLSSGIYIYQLTGTGVNVSKKMMLMK